MNCLRCELTRAKMKALLLPKLGWTLEELALHLSERYGVRYYVEGGNLYRASLLPPYQPHLIKEGI